MRGDGGSQVGVVASGGNLMAVQFDALAPSTLTKYGERMKLKFILAFVLSIVLVGCGENPETWPVVVFDKSTWAKTPEENRFVFARDLIENKRLNGMTLREVIHELGPPSFSDNSSNYITYVLKVSSGNLYILDIRLKQGGKAPVVNEVFVRAD